MKELYDDKFENLYMPECADEWLELVHDIAIDYDGYKNEEGLKSLIDEMVKYVDNARKCIRQGKIKATI